MKTLKTCLVILIAFAIGCSKNDKVTPPDAVAPTLSDFDIPSKGYGDVPFKITPPKSNSDGAITYVSSNLKVADISGDILTVVEPGSCTITAYQAATSKFKADSVKAKFTVWLGENHLTDFKIADHQLGDPPFKITPPNSKAGTQIVYKSLNPTVADIERYDMIVIKGAGVCTIVATQSDSPGYIGGSTTATFRVTGLPAPTISGFTVPAKKVGDAPFSLSHPTSNSNGAFTYKSSNTSVATVNGSTVTIKAAGTSVITAIQTATSTYRTDSIKATLTVAGLIRPSLVNFKIPAKKTTDAPFSLTPPTSNSNGSFIYTSGNTAIATIQGNIVTIKGKGKTLITATQQASGNYSSASVQDTLFVTENPDPGYVTDVEGNMYRTVRIGTQVWMAENLKVKSYNDGTPIRGIETDNAWKSATVGAVCDYNNDPGLGRVYGKLYNWYAITDPRKLAPKGYHIPTQAEWQTLYDYIGGTETDGGALQETGGQHWTNAKAATNSTLFTALAAGGRDFIYTNQSFTSLLQGAYWWSVTPGDATTAWFVELYSSAHIELRKDPKYYGYSVRCIKD
ncbi:uncharacterized protein (TIGR02145 family) [Mucilaginibacter rubeus]|uniref:FISUMP domain-containing protein n=1 Tax=Mucilaginibacter rubeus TaxID=2027860 RepID=UPI003392783D